MDFVQKIDKLREQIQQIKEELIWLDEAPLDQADLKARVHEWMAHIHESSGTKDLQGSFLALRSPAGKASHIDMLQVKGRVSVPAVPHASSVNISMASQLVWLFGDQLTQILLAKVDAMDYVPGLPLAERPRRRTQLQKELRVLEEKEEVLICESEEAKAAVHRRADADPAVVLSYDPNGDTMAFGTAVVAISRHAPTVNPAAS